MSYEFRSQADTNLNVTKTYSGFTTERKPFHLPYIQTEIHPVVSKLADCSKSFTHKSVPTAVEWTVSEVANWIRDIGFPQYTECFRVNNIDGKQLIKIEASALPKMGITKWDDIKILTKHIRELLNLEDPNYKRTIRLPPRNSLGMYLEAKSYIGTPLSCTSFPVFEYATRDSVWEPPLENRGLIFRY
uniref:SAM domain-containing protein n=1 Tax=Trichobilharzia regenti TaxID=157069 RepID=A0AA85K9J7_TRIRE|nr:unnamed protein product [Trichobilharzia regenti]